MAGAGTGRYRHWLFRSGFTGDALAASAWVRPPWRRSAVESPVGASIAHRGNVNHWARGERMSRVFKLGRYVAAVLLLAAVVPARAGASVSPLAGMVVFLDPGHNGANDDIDHAAGSYREGLHQGLPGQRDLERRWLSRAQLFCVRVRQRSCVHHVVHYGVFAGHQAIV